MARLLDIQPISFVPGTTETHKSIAIGANLFVAYIPPGAKSVLIQATVDDVRFTLDGTTPTAAIGFRLFADGFPLLFELNERTILKFFGEGATSVLQYCFGN